MTTTKRNVHRPTINIALPKSGAPPALISYAQGIVWSAHSCGLER
jgi:hypothetical protein